MDLHAYLPFVIYGFKLILKFNFIIEIHLNDQALIIIDHQLIQHQFDLSDDFGVIELGVFQLAIGDLLHMRERLAILLGREQLKLIIDKDQLALTLTLNRPTDNVLILLLFFDIFG